ncbi:hypothetical protein M0R45_036014 [Rubus argutus]|uniref:Uncharacterized protein n=1 Tax=Rubus argutus TaxID=59490 RepID=A0AAW1VYN0_RUBAR
MLVSRERVGHKFEAFHDYWLGAFSRFKDYVKSGGHDSRTKFLELSDGIECSVKWDLEMRKNTDGKRVLVMEGEDRGVKNSIRKKGGDRCKRRKIRPKLLEEISKKKVENLEQEKEKTIASSSSIFTSSHKINLRPREPPNTIPSSNDDEDKNDDDDDDDDEEASLLVEERGQSGHGSSHKDDGFGVGSNSSGIPKAPLLVAPTFPTQKFEEVLPQVKDFVYWSARFEGSAKVLDSIERLYPLTYSEDNLLPFHDMHICPDLCSPNQVLRKLW